MHSTSLASPAQVSLREELQNFNAQLARQLPAETAARLRAAIDDVIESQPAAGALQVGQLAPDFALPEVAGETLTLSRHTSRGPVVLSFYRGSWCPYCDLQLRAYSRMVPELMRLGAQLITVSPQMPSVDVPNAQTHRALGFPLLVDAGNAVARRYGLVHSVDEQMRSLLAGFGLDLAAINGMDRWELPVPATFIVATDHRIRWAYVEADYRMRAEPADILQAVAALR
jgi:peroxiredoxin